MVTGLFVSDSWFSEKLPGIVMSAQYSCGEKSEMLTVAQMIVGSKFGSCTVGTSSNVLSLSLYVTYRPFHVQNEYFQCHSI